MVILQIYIALAIYAIVGALIYKGAMRVFRTETDVKIPKDLYPVIFITYLLLWPFSTLAFVVILIYKQSDKW